MRVETRLIGHTGNQVIQYRRFVTRWFWFRLKTRVYIRQPLAKRCFIWFVVSWYYHPWKCGKRVADYYLGQALDIANTKQDVIAFPKTG